MLTKREEKRRVVDPFRNAVQTMNLKNLILFFLQKIKIFLYVLDRFDVLISKIIFKK